MGAPLGAGTLWDPRGYTWQWGPSELIFRVFFGVWEGKPEREGLSLLHTENHVRISGSHPPHTRPRFGTESLGRRGETRRVFIVSSSSGVQPLPGPVRVRVRGRAAPLGVPARRLSPPEAPHGPDPAARVPRGVDVRGCEGKAEGPSVEGDGALRGWRAPGERGRDEEGKSCGNGCLKADQAPAQ